MFGLFKRKDKDKAGGEDTAWGQPGTGRKLSKEEAAREEAAQQAVDARGKERRDMYRPAGRERLFNDSEGRRMALRVEDNSGPGASPHHPPLQILVFWGTREVGHIQAAVESNRLRQTAARIEAGYENRGIAAELLGELEAVAREKGLTEIVCQAQADGEWSQAFLAQAGYTPRGNELVKTV